MNRILCGISYCILFAVIFQSISADLAKSGQFKYQVSVRNQNNEHLCSGTIINENWILTAAQCVQGANSKATNLIAVVGSHKINATNGQNHSIEMVVSHQGFNWTTRENDIALIRTHTSMKLDYFSVFPAAMPTFLTNHKIENGIGLTKVTQSGWYNQVKKIQTN